MTFDIDKFEQKQFRNRTVDVPVPELKSFFQDDEAPVWIIKCLSATELSEANEAVESNRNLEAVISAVSGKSRTEKVEAVKDVLGLPTDKTPNDLVRRFSMLVSGSVSPECPQNIAVKLAENFPTTFFKLTNKIIELTGRGKLGE